MKAIFEKSLCDRRSAYFLLYRMNFVNDYIEGYWKLEIMSADEFYDRGVLISDL